MAMNEHIHLPDLKTMGLIAPLAIYVVRPHSRLVIRFGMKIFGGFK